MKCSGIKRNPWDEAWNVVTPPLLFLPPFLSLKQRQKVGKLVSYPGRAVIKIDKYPDCQTQARKIIQEGGRPLLKDVNQSNTANDEFLRVFQTSLNA